MCKLHRALYGLRQAPRAWYGHLSSRLIELGFSKSKSDQSLFILQHQGTTIYFLIYANDVILTGSSLEVLDQLLKVLCCDFPFKSLDDLHYFLGIQCHCTSIGMILSQ